jgi:hypothetical protein
LERGEKCGSNGTSLTVAVAVLMEIWQFKKGVKKVGKMCRKNDIWVVGILASEWQWLGGCKRCRWKEEIGAVI